MYHITVNGKEYTADEDKRLMDFLREDLDLTSVKNGCGQGACGACMVIMDGQKVRSCLRKISDCDGRSIVTLEGLSEREEQVYSYAFASAGAVQCGYCTPGMVISAKVLLDTNLNPEEEDINKAIEGNLCRCTGYVKIVKAIKLAAACFRGEVEPILNKAEGHVGERAIRQDAVDKILGKAKFAGDLKVPGMVYGSALHSKYPRALIKNISI
ncbi:MAG: 2Fe-2S iron-sulfur cluster-binding protein, partial [Lachnospiraceae bacterium]|nr:2Fe-2S iron-sulfur cluster-binding protein [Lachnospiraceae bacterium]